MTTATSVFVPEAGLFLAALLMWFLNDGLTLLIFGMAFMLIWCGSSTSFGTAMILGAMLIIPLKGVPVESWFGMPVFVGQPSLVFTCIALAAVHYRLGPLAAHRVWRVVSISLVLLALVLPKFQPNGALAHGEDTIRLWASMMLQFIFIGGIGQVLWRIVRVEGVWRYAVTWIAFPISSALHSYVAFYGHPNFEQVALWSAASAVYFGSIMLAASLVLLHYLSDKETAEDRIRRSADELINGSRS